MALGSSYSSVKWAIHDQLAARAGLQGVAVSYQAPVQATDVQDSSGSGEAIWLDDGAGEHNNVVICSLPLQIEEQYQISVIVQVLRPSSLGTQREADLRVDELLYEVLHELATDPTWGLSNVGNFVYLHTTRSTFQRVTGFLPSGAGHGARAELNLQVDSRLRFT